ncbi:MAG: hypothetical protein FWF44_09265 [Defluviitaleaceae bacterium]|nr:hypothetical protein [Defluviitaleaceae bacterium]
MKASDVFTPGGYPSVTLVNDHIEQKKCQLLNTLKSGGIAVSLSGPSKSGKTVFVQNSIEKDDLIIVNAAGVTSAEMLWKRVFAHIGTPIAKNIVHTKGISHTASGNISGGMNFLVAKGNAGGSLSRSSVTSDTTTDENVNDYLQILINELKDTGMILFIDDFHYMSRDIQSEVAKQIKEAIRNDIKIVCASVPYHAGDTIAANPDLSGRIVSINFDFWKEDLLIKIAEKGFSQLNVHCDIPFLLKLAREAAGSPQLMQYICLYACSEAGIEETRLENIILPTSDEFLKKVCTYAAATAQFKQIYETMKEGPKIRGKQRTSYVLKDGFAYDVYPIILKAIAAEPPNLTFRYSDLQKRIGNICENETQVVPV